MKNILLIFSAFIISLSAVAENGSDHRRLIINKTDGIRNVYDVTQLTRITFDSIETVAPIVTTVASQGFSIEISVEIPEDCPMFRVAVVKIGTEIGNWTEYISDNYIATGTESGNLTLGGLAESAVYQIGALAYDRYGMPSGVSVIEAETTVADPSELPQIGYILYSDGSWSRRRQNGKTPVGIIFSTETSEADKESGYTHGYAIALRDAASKICWTETPAPLQTDWYTSSVAYGYLTDMDGLSHTRILQSKGIETFPAAKAALEYDAPAPPSSSGWYLPASGQWYDICVNIGGLSSELPRLGETEGYWNGLQDCSNSLQRINEYLSLAGKDNYEKITVAAGDYQWFWSSSEMSEQQAYVIFFDNDQLVVELAGYFKNYSFTSNRVRAVIAF